MICLQGYCKNQGDIKTNKAVDLRNLLRDFGFFIVLSTF